MPPVEVLVVCPLLVDHPPLLVLPPDELVDVEDEPLVEDEVLEEVDELDEVEDEPLVEVETLPEDDEVEVTLPEEVEVDEPPVDVEVDEPPVEVEVEPPEVLVDPPEVELELPPEPPDEVEVEPLLVEVMTMSPPEEPLLPPKKPPKNPPPKPPPNPPPPLVTTTVPPPLGGSGGIAGGGRGIIAICGAGSHETVRVTIRRTRLTLRGASRRTTRLRALTGPLTCLTYCGAAEAGASATCTAPPPTSAPPAAQADSFARAIRTDISVAFSSSPEGTKGR